MIQVISNTSSIVDRVRLKFSSLPNIFPILISIVDRVRLKFNSLPNIFPNRKRKNGYIYKNKQKTRRANNNHKIKSNQHTTTNYLRKQNKRGYQEGTHKEVKRDKNKKNQKP